MNLVESNTFKPIILVVIVCASFLVIGFFLVVPEFEKLPVDFEFYMEHDGVDQIASDPYGELSKPFKLKELLEQKITHVNGNIVTIASRVSGERIDNNEVVFDLTQEFRVDRSTLMHVDKEEKLFGFKPNVQKQNYDFFHPLVFDNSILIYQGTEIINGLEVYVFTADIKYDDVSSAFPQFSPHIIKSDTSSKLWVEPITGDLIRFDKHWEDYLVEDGVRINTIQLGSKTTTSYSEFILSEATKSKINFVNIYKTIIPVLIISFGMISGMIIILTKRLELARIEMRKQEKLSTVGKLASRLAHDLRNPLSVIMNMTTLNEISPAITKEEVERRKQMVNRAVERMTHQIDRVMDFVRIKPLEFKTTSIKTIIEFVKESIIIPKDIKIILEGDNPTISCDIREMDALFSNLISNSIQAMESSGVITIKVIDEDMQIVIKVEDLGPGIAKKNLKKIFEPLFTTKQEGTGLGLVSCKNIVEHHGDRSNKSNFSLGVLLE